MSEQATGTVYTHRMHVTSVGKPQRVYTRRMCEISVCKPQGESTPTGHNLILKKNSAELYFTKLNIKPQRQLVFQGRKLGTMAIFPIVFVLISKVIYYKNAISTKMCR